ncbi:hypothetical protein HYALB_00011070 [Hymenoscyphus albidus]|uniref:Transcription factor domain-containing protein n=1 Tax=Hymenoscyphus albidus TaxID=595503 RepID=A0A9N9LDS1_9HELO|nr:hypothetical protein HYALB_00011070 [Hymenoscyphus albidus]
MKDHRPKVIWPAWTVQRPKRNARKRGPGRSIGNARNGKHTKNKESSSSKTGDPVTSDVKKNVDRKVKLNNDKIMDDGTGCFQLDFNNTPYIEHYLPGKDPNEMHYIHDISKQELDPSLSLDTFMLNDYFNINHDFNSHQLNESIDISLSSGTHSTYALSPAAFNLPSENYFPMMDVIIPDQTTVPIDTADGPFPALEGWPLFRCNQIVPTSACSTTAKSHLESLYAALNTQNLSLDECRLTDHHHVAIEPLLAGTRDKLIAIMQGFSNRAQTIHGLRNAKQENASSMIDANAPFFLILPLPHVLESLLRACLSCYEPYYPVLSAASLKTNKLMEGGNNAVISSLKLLFMLAAGAMTSGAGDTYQIAHGLIEIGRISLSYLLEEDIKLVSNPELLQCALLFIIVAAWSGDKWQMDMAIYQKAMYLEMLSKEKFLERREFHVSTLGSATELDHSWQRWKEQESINRMVYSWVLLDQEMCLFQDSPSTLFTSLTALNTAVSSPSTTWRATSAKEWMHSLPHSHLQSGNVFPPSLNEYIVRFRETENPTSLTDLTPTVLRLLLCHIQSLVSQVRLSIAGIHGNSSNSNDKSFKAIRYTSMVLVSVRLDEARDLLQKWYSLSQSVFKGESTPTINATMVLYHLIVLNTLVSFPEVERMARGEDSSIKRPSKWKQPHHFEDTRNIYFHCGQILRIIRSMSEGSRPAWWAGAVYRVALIAWANCMSCSDIGSPSMSEYNKKPSTHLVMLDSLAAESPLIISYVKNAEGTPVFSEGNGGAVPLEVPGIILAYCTRFLGVDQRNKFIMGTRLKLLALADRWEAI